MGIVHAWGPMIATLAVMLPSIAFVWRQIDQKIDVRIDGLDQKIDVKVSALEQRIDGLDQKIDVKVTALDQKIDGVEARLGTRIDALADVTDRRLTALETDMTIIKQHLLNSPAA